MAFIRGFYGAIFGIKHLRVSLGMKYEICVWFDFIQNFNCSLGFLDVNWLFNDRLHLYIESAGNHQLWCDVCISMVNGRILYGSYNYAGHNIRAYPLAYIHFIKIS